VNFFFVLNGFLITYLLIEEKKLNGQIDVKKFWLRRALRIWPMFYFCVGFGFFIFPILKTAFGQIPNETASLISYLTFINNFELFDKGLPDASVLGALWSVAIEEQFYLVWPIILYLLPIKKYWIPFVIIIVTSVTYRYFNQSYILQEFHTLSCIGAFGAWLVLENATFKKIISQLNVFFILLLYFVFVLIFLFRDDFLIHNSLDAFER